jgi:hypothetical protein
MTLVQFLEIVISLLLFSNKILVLIDKKSGWAIGAIGCFIAMWYLYLLKLYVFTILEIGLIVLMMYGYLAGKEKKDSVEKLIIAFLIIVMASLTYFLFEGSITVYQFIGGTTLIIGTYCLTHGKPITGWILYCIGHLVTAYIGYNTKPIPQTFFADFQIASAIVSIVAIVKIRKKH